MMSACANSAEGNKGAETGSTKTDQESTAGSSSKAEESGGTKTYKVSYNTNNGNVEDMPQYQFLSGNMKGMVKNDSRVFVDITLELDGAEAYKLESDCYIIEAGKRAEAGDETGIGLTLTTEAEGSYEDNGDGTVTISVPSHAVHELASDTYSSQMKDAAGIHVAGGSEDGKWDSGQEASILDFVPETIFTLEDESIVTYTYLHPEEYETQDSEKDDAKAEDGKNGGQKDETLGNEILSITSDDEGTVFKLT